MSDHLEPDVARRITKPARPLSRQALVASCFFFVAAVVLTALIAAGVVTVLILTEFHR